MKADLEERLDAVLDILSIAKVDELWIQPSSSLLHVPVAKHPDEHLEKDLLNGLSYAKEKLAELTALKEGLVSGKAAISEQIQQAKADIQALKQFATSANSEQKKELEQLSDKDFKRPIPFEERLALQNESLGLPLLPTTTIGSFRSLLKCGAHAKNGGKMSGLMNSTKTLSIQKQNDGLIFRKNWSLMCLCTVNLNGQTWSNTSVKSWPALPSQNTLGFNHTAHAVSARQSFTEMLNLLNR